MTNIQHIAGQSRAFAERFTRDVPGFMDSDEYRLLDEEDRGTPGLVLSAVATYLENAGDREVRAAATIMEDAAVTDEDELHNYIVTEIFESWRGADPLTRERLVRMLGPQSRALYERWTNPIVPRA